MKLWIAIVIILVVALIALASGYFWGKSVETADCPCAGTATTPIKTGMNTAASTQSGQ